MKHYYLFDGDYLCQRCADDTIMELTEAGRDEHEVEGPFENDGATRRCCWCEKEIT